MTTQRGDGTIRGSRAYPNHSHFNEMEGVGLAYTSASTVTMQTEFASFTTENGKRVFEPDADIVLDITTSGSGGLDTGSEAANTWYSCWLVVAANGAPSDVIGLLSTSKTVSYTHLTLPTICSV